MVKNYDIIIKNFKKNMYFPLIIPNVIAWLIKYWDDIERDLDKNDERIDLLFTAISHAFIIGLSLSTIGIHFSILCWMESWMVFFFYNLLSMDSLLCQSIARWMIRVIFNRFHFPFLYTGATFRTTIFRYWFLEEVRYNTLCHCFQTRAALLPHNALSSLNCGWSASQYLISISLYYLDYFVAHRFLLYGFHITLQFS